MFYTVTINKTILPISGSQLVTEFDTTCWWSEGRWYFHKLLSNNSRNFLNWHTYSLYERLESQKFYDMLLTGYIHQQVYLSKWQTSTSPGGQTCLRKHITKKTDCLFYINLYILSFSKKILSDIFIFSLRKPQHQNELSS